MAKLISYEEATGAEPTGKLISYEEAAGAQSSPRSAIGEIANQGYAGAVSDLPQMIGKAMQYSSDPGHAIYDTGKSLSDWATKQGERPDLQAHPDQHNVVTNALAAGARMIPQSIAPAAVVGGALAAAPVGLSGAALLGASALLGSAPAAMSQGQETLDKGLAAGLPRDKAIEAARINALIEGGGETLGTYAGGKLFGIGANAIGKIAKSGAQGGAGKALSELTSPGIVKPWLKQIPETAAVEVGTEIGQNAGEAAIERAYGIDNKSPYEAGKEAIAPTLGMTALLAPFGLAGFASGAHFARQKAAALASPETVKENRAQISDEYYAELAKVDQSAANNFKVNADRAIVSGSELPIDESLFSPAKQSPITTAAASAVRSGATFKAEFDRVMQEEQALAAEQSKTAKQGPKNEQSQEASTQGSEGVSRGEDGATQASGQVSGSYASTNGEAQTAGAEQPAGGGLSQSQIVQPGAATPAVGVDPAAIERRAQAYYNAGNALITEGRKEEGLHFLAQGDAIARGEQPIPFSPQAVEPVSQQIQGAIQPDVTLPQEAITSRPGQSAPVSTTKELQKERLDQSNNGIGKGARKGISQKQSSTGTGYSANDTVRKASGPLQESGVANPVNVYTPDQAIKQFGTPAQPTTGGILPQQSTALDVPSALQGRSQVKTSQDQSKAVSKEGTDAIDLSNRTDKQLAYLSTNGRPGYKESAIAEIAKRAGTSQPAKVVSSLPTSPAAKMGSGQGYEYGKIGGMLKTGQIVLTASGRKTTPFPRFAFKTGRTTNAHVHAVDQWLLQNAADEAVARGDSFNAPVFQADVNQKSIPQASKDAAEEYLFGEQPAVLPSILKPLVADKKPANEVQTPEPKVAATVKDNLTVQDAEQPKDYDKAKATDLAKRMTKQGAPSEAYPHPTIADRYAIRKTGTGSSAKEPATPLQESGAPSEVVQPSQQPDAVAAPKTKPTMAERRAAAEAKRKAKTDDDARKVADSAPKVEEKPLWKRTIADAVGPQVVIPEVDKYPRLEKIARDNPERLTDTDNALLDKKKKQVSARAKALREHKPYLERANAHYAAVKNAIAQGETIPDEVKAGYPHLFKDEQKPVHPAKEEKPANDDLRGYAYAIVKDGRILTSGSFPSPKYMEASDDTKVSKWRDEAERLGADLYIGGYPQQTEWKPQEGLIFGMTWEELRDRQQKKAVANLPIQGKMPKDAVLVFNGKAEAEKPAQPAKPEPAAKPEAVTLSSHDALMKSARAGTLPADDLKAAFAATKENESAIMAELSAMTKDALLKRMGGIAAARWKSDKKADVVRAAWSDMLSDFALSRPYSYSMGKDSQAKAIAALVESTKDKDIADFAAKVESQTKDYLERLNNYKKAITNPESLEDFRTFVRVNGEAGLTVEQRARYDDLRSDDTRASSQEKKATVGAAYVKVGAKLVETKHTRDGHELFVVQLETRVERDAYDRLNAAAKKLGGRYSYYAKGGAIPGFQFKDKASAEAFQKLASEGDTTAAQEVVTDRVESNKVERKSAAAERLIAMAERMEEKGNEALSRDRLTNTAKRARQASSAEADASALVAMAKTMRNLAAAIQSGEAKHLEGVKNRAQIEMLDTLAKNAQRKILKRKYPSYYDQERHKVAPLTAEDADAAEWPTATADHGDLLSVIRLLAESGKPTVKALSAKIERLANTSSERIPVPIEIIEQVRSKLVGTQQQRSIPWYWEIVQERVKRLASMGITDLPMLRAAIREYVQFKEVAPKANKAKELERALIGNKGIGIDFFPTPKSVAQDMVRMADIQPGMKVLEPSAGNGNIAEAIEAAGVAPDVVEMSGSLREILDAKGFNIVGQDFMHTTGNYDRIVMNPPFSNRMDVDHVQHAYTLLNPGGKIVAIMGEGVFFGSDTKAKQFREWLDSVGGTSEKLPDGTFTDRTLMATTGVNSRIVEIEKPGDTRFNVASILKISPADSAVYEMARDGKSAAEILEFLGKASRNGFNRYLANALRNLGVSSTIKIDSMGGWNFNQSKHGAKYAAAYSPKTDTIALFTPREAERHALHELTHAATLKAIEAGGRAALEMKRLFEHVKASGKLDGMYGMTNLDEFVAEAFSNPEFQRALMKVLAPRGYTVKTVWDAFVRFVARLVGLKSPALQSALDKAMVLGAELMRENAKLSGKGGDTRFAIAHHGTPHLFAPEPGFPHGRFRLDKMGTGEGAQAYGWGVYFASNKDVAKNYQQAEGAYKRISGGMTNEQEFIADHLSQGRPEMSILDLYAQKYGGSFDDAMTNLIAVKDIYGKGTLYRLDIPDDVMPKLMDWDKPLSEQQAAVRKALEASGVVNFTENVGPTSTGEIRNFGWSSNVGSILGDKFYHRLIEKEFTGKPTTSSARREAEKAASEYLASIGIPGLRYLDGQSRTDGEGTHNYVIWDQKTLDRIALLERNGEKLDDIRFSQESDTINDAQKAAREIVEAMREDDGADYGLRVIPGEFSGKIQKGDKLPPSKRWEDGNETADDLDGTSAAAIARADEASVMDAINNLGAGGEKGPNGYYFGNRIALIKGDKVGAGDDVGEVMIGNAEVVGMWNKPTKGLSSIVPNGRDTINVDGTDRPRTNSNGKPIAGTDEALRKFWRWFSGSKIVDEGGRPLVVYHGSASTEITKFMPNGNGEGSDKSLDNFRKSVASNSKFGYMGFRSGTFFSPDAEYAGHYTGENGGAMYPSYIKAESPVYKDQISGKVTSTQGRTPDALIMSEGSVMNEIAVIDPLQVKSATGNSGEFNPENPDIRFNVESSDQWASSSADNNTLDDIIYKIANKQIDLRRTVQDITKKIGEIADEYNPELSETLYHGRAANETKNFLDFELRPLIRRMLALGVDTETLETYLWARHAEERNEQIAKINPRLPDGGSGLTNEQARQLLSGQDVTIDGKTIKGVPQDKMVEIGELVSMSDAILKKSRELLVDSGLESKAEVDSWSSMYQHYVPLHREEFADDRMTGKGLGMSIKGPSGKRAIGSEKPVSNILASIVSQRELYITRAEKNKVGNATYGLATIAPNEDFWQAIDPMANASRDAQQLWAKIRKHTEIIASKPDGDEAMEAIIDAMKAQHKALMKKAVPGMKKVKEALEALGLPAEMADRILAEPKELTINKHTGMVVERVNPLLRHLDNVLSTRINGRDVFVVFNARNKRASRMALAMKNLDADNLGFLLGNMAKATRYFSAINTQFNPIFGVTNLTRDIQTAMLNLSSTPLAGHKIEIAKRTFSALRGIYSDLRNHREGKAPTSKWAATFEQFKKHGGATGYRDMYDTLNDRAKDLQDELRKMSMSKARRMVTLGQSNPVFAWLSDYNEMMENAVRVAAFSVAIEQDPSTGRPRMSPAQAAALAKELTVNFNRKGQVAAQAGAMYAFFNAAVQGTARIAQTLVTLENGKPKLTSAGKKIIAGGVSIGVVQAILGALAGWDDEEPPQFVRERSLIIPFGDHYFSIPMPLGYNVLPNIGRITTEFALSGFKDPAKRISSLLNVMADTFNPIGNAGMSLQTIAPTVIDPLAALSENKDWTGKPIKRMTFNEESAGYKNAKDTATAWSKLIAEGLNYLTGGTEHKAGLMSPTPDQIDYLIGQVTGGVGREVSKVVQTGSSVISGEELPLYKVPLVGKFVGSTTGQAAESSRFYANIQELKAHKAEIDGRRKAHQDVAGYIQDNPDARLVPMATRIEHRVQELRRAKRALLEKNAPQDQIKAIDARITAYMKALNGKVEVLQRNSM